MVENKRKLVVGPRIVTIGLADKIELAHSRLKALVCKALTLAYFMCSDIGLLACIGPLQHEINCMQSPCIGPFYVLYYFTSLYSS